MKTISESEIQAEAIRRVENFEEDATADEKATYATFFDIGANWAIKTMMNN